MTVANILPWKGEEKMDIKAYFDENTKVIEAAFPDVKCCFSVANYSGGLTFFLHAGDNVGVGRSFSEAMDKLEKTVVAES